MAEERGYGRASVSEGVGRHSVNIENREKISISGVDDVESFDESVIVAYTNMGVLTLKGEGFRISKLNVDSGELIVEGEVESISYSESHSGGKSGGLFSKLFK